MKEMRKIKKPLIKLGKVRSASLRLPRTGTDTRQILERFSPRSQRVVVKVKQSYSNSPGAWKAHGRYLERDAARFGDGFSENDENVRIAKTLRSWQEAGDEKLHKIILSPEYSDRIDLREHTRDVMSRMEQDLGRSIEWVAIIHKNTDNHHVHIALRGVDGAGKSMDVEEYLGSSLRERSKDRVTKELGPRLYPEILRRREKELFARRFTDIDRALLWKANEHFILSIPERSSRDWQKNKTREQRRIRLTFLTEFGLAERISQESWRLSPDLRESLKRLGLVEQLIREQVPGWEFLRTLRNSGVSWKRLELGEGLTGRVVGTGIRDPFGDRQFMLIEAANGFTYQMNQPRGIEQGGIKAEDIVTLTRRSASLRDDKTGKMVEREFTAVQKHPEWRKSLELDYEAVAKQNASVQDRRIAARTGFSKEWAKAVRERSVLLRNKGLDSKSPNWKNELEAIRFAEADPQAVPWNPREFLHVGDAFRGLEPSRLVIGEILSTSEERILIEDLRDGVSRVVSLKDVGLNWAPSVGTMVVVEAKQLPHMEIRPSDERITALLSVRDSFDEDNLNNDEKTFILSRANTWVRWGILTQDADGAFRGTTPDAAPSEKTLLIRMEEKLEEVRETLTEKIRKQPAWLKALTKEGLSTSTDDFVTLDRLLGDIGPVPENSRETWLTEALRLREALWEKRGVWLDEHFEKNARAWLSTGVAPTMLREGESITGRVTDLSVNEDRYFSVDSADGKIRHFQLTERTREKIESGMLEVGDVVTLTGKSFEEKGRKHPRRIHYTEMQRLYDWTTSEVLLRGALTRSATPRLEEQNFAAEWQAQVFSWRGKLQSVLGKELLERKLESGEVLKGVILNLDINDGTKLLLQGTDGKPYLLYQSRKIRGAVARNELRVGESVRFVGKEAEIDGKNIRFTDFNLTGSRERRIGAGGRSGASRPSREIEVGKPVRGTVTEIGYRSDQVHPEFVLLKAEDGSTDCLRASRGISRLVTQGLIQVGDEVRLSAREFTRDGRQLYYTEFEHENVRKRILRDREKLFGRLISREIHNERYVLLDTPGGKVHLRASRSIKNQIKSGELRVGDVLFVSAKEQTTLQLDNGGEVRTLSARVLNNWKRSEQFDQAVVTHLQSNEVIEDVPNSQTGFAAEWLNALKSRGEEFEKAGVLKAENWRMELQKVRERERYEERKRPAKLSDIRPSDLRSPARLETLFVQAVKEGWIVGSEANALNFICAATKATRSRHEPVRLFVDIVKNNDWKQIHQQDEDRARKLLVSYRERFVKAFSTPEHERELERSHEK